MTLNAGTRLGQYEIVAPIGKGGMGEVYRARDTKLGRDVAIKVLPDEFSQDKERLDRFEREARLLAQLNHPNIATLHGLEESEKRQFLVMELVEGESLAERIARGPVPPIPIDEAIRLFTQIARGLEAAHDKGVIHRDLKPANVMITPEGNVKLLDFGLAKAFASDDAGGVDSSASPTLTKGTALGVIMGTAAYMSPEQARGTTADRRADVWAFGVSLYEALTGERAFAGATVSDTLAAVLRAEPDWRALPATVPSSMRRVLQRCLRKEPSERLHDIADVRIEIEDAMEATEEPVARQPLAWWQRPAGALIAAIVLAVVIGSLSWWLSPF